MSTKDELEKNVVEIKTILRHAALVARAKLTSKFQESAANSLKKYFPYLGLETGQVCSGYWPIRNEIDPRALIEEMKLRGHPCALPVVVGDKIVFREFKDANLLVKAGFGTLGPDDSVAEILPDLLLVPLAAYDRFGGRIGYGRGYYDKAITKLKAEKPIRSVGVAYSVQEVEKVPMENHDQFLDLIVTEQGLVTCKRE